jgi:hypothetical protein
MTEETTGKNLGGPPNTLAAMGGYGEMARDWERVLTYESAAGLGLRPLEDEQGFGMTRERFNEKYPDSPTFRTKEEREEMTRR